MFSTVSNRPLTLSWENIWKNFSRLAEKIIDAVAFLCDQITAHLPKREWPYSSVTALRRVTGANTSPPAPTGVILSFLKAERLGNEQQHALASIPPHLSYPVIQTQAPNRGSPQSFAERRP